MYIVVIKNEKGQVVRTLYSRQYGDLKAALVVAYGIAAGMKEKCHVEYRMTAWI